MRTADGLNTFRENNSDQLVVSNVNSKGYGIIPKMVMQDQRLHINAKAIYAYFNSFAGTGNSAFPTRKRICYDLGISGDTFGKYLKQLTDTGYLKVTQNKVAGRFSNNVYTICDTISIGNDNSDTDNTDTETIGNGKMVTNNNNVFKNNSSKNNNSKNNSGEKKESKKGSFDSIIADYTNDEKVIDLLQEWLKVRKAKRAAMTDRSIKMNIDKLDELALKSNMSVEEYLSEVICRGWAAFYEVKNYGDGNTPKQNNTSGNIFLDIAKEEGIY